MNVGGCVSVPEREKPESALPHPLVVLKWARLELLNIETDLIRIRSRVEMAIRVLEEQQR